MRLDGNQPNSTLNTKISSTANPPPLPNAFARSIFVERESEPGVTIRATVRSLGALRQPRDDTH
jgi:hypothetical protein